MVVFGFGAVGRAGNASEFAAFAFAVRESGGLEEGREVVGEGREEVEADGVSQGVAPTLPAPARLAEAEVDAAGGMGGKGLAAAALPQLPWRLTAEREDCCVELLSFSTRRPPPLLATDVAAEEPGKMPLGPGRVG